MCDVRELWMCGGVPASGTSGALKLPTGVTTGPSHRSVASCGASNLEVFCVIWDGRLGQTKT
jgi:hypothetical protein